MNGERKPSGAPGIRSGLSAPSPTASHEKPIATGLCWGGRIRTFNRLIQSQVSWIQADDTRTPVKARDGGGQAPFPSGESESLGPSRADWLALFVWVMSVGYFVVAAVR